MSLTKQLKIMLLNILINKVKKDETNPLPFLFDLTNNFLFPPPIEF